MSLQLIPSPTIDDVIARLDAVLDRCIRERCRLGYFAALYRDVTVQVRAAIVAGEFDDGPRMERLDVTFASRYLDALERFWRGEPPTRSWLVAFRSAYRWRPVVLQHLLLGMNAHINLDLGIAAALTAPGAELPALRADFERITGLLQGMIGGQEQRLERVSPWLGLVDRVGGRGEERIVGFAIGEAREIAWRAAQRLALVAPAEREREIALQDTAVALLAQAIQSPGPLLASALEIVRIAERKRVPAVIEALRT